MDKTVRCFNGAEFTASIPYTHMGPEDATLFYYTMNKLLTFANSELGLLPRERIVIDGPSNSEKDLGSYVGEHLWQNRRIVRRFVVENPYSLPKECLEAAALWHDAVHDLFVCVQADEDCATYMSGNRLFCVGAMEKGADAHVHTLPSLMVLTLLPFKGGIVTDGKTMHISDCPTPFTLPYLSSACDSATSTSVISTAGELVAYGRNRYRPSQITPQIQRMVDGGLDALVSCALAA